MRLVRNVWTRGGVDARVKAVKYMWALFACNDLLFRRFGVGRSGDCEVCHGRRETAWHVMGRYGMLLTATRKPLTSYTPSDC